jgi:recombination protein RecA
VSALVPKAELDGDMGDSHMGLQARLMSQAMRKLSGITEKSGTTLIFINQIREKIGVMFGSPETTSGGRALKFYSSVRLDIRRRAAILEGGKDSRELGFNMEVKAIKNKCGVPKKSTILRLYYPGESDIVGFDKIGDLLEFGSARGVIELKGAWYNFNGERIGQGFDNAREALAGNPEWLAKIVKAVKESK